MESKGMVIGVWQNRNGKLGAELENGKFLNHAGRVMPLDENVWTLVGDDVDDIDSATLLAAIAREEQLQTAADEICEQKLREEAARVKREKARKDRETREALEAFSQSMNDLFRYAQSIPRVRS